MQFDRKPTTVSELVKALKESSLVPNEDYQRGADWSLPQQQCFIDSLFRDYPVPPLFLQGLDGSGLYGRPSTRFEIVDGQQRLRALRHYREDKFSLLETDDRRLRLPHSLRKLPAPWASRRFSDLSEDLQRKFDHITIDTLLIAEVKHRDEVRDLFIRLQSGTALSRQQIRDAWPGTIGPFIERLAGKLDRRPALSIFGLVDRRGARIDDEDQLDRFVADRQTCAQLLRLFLARERDARSFPSVSANSLDAMYHEHTEFDPKGESAELFVNCLNQASSTLRLSFDRRAKNHGTDRAGKIKMKKLDLFSIVLFFQDMSKNPQCRIDLSRLAENFTTIQSLTPAGKGTAGSRIREYYDAWRAEMTKDVGISLDGKRAFDDDQKHFVWNRQSGKCAICQNELAAEGAEADHWKVPWRDGGPTSIENCRIVCKLCHSRGRPVDDES